MSLIPNEIKIGTHMLEYNPGVYGDFICDIVSNSVDGFFSPRYKENERYWYSNNSSILRNQYPLSCRGGGYEHVERYTEFMLAHKMFLDFPELVDDAILSGYENMIFNTHPKLPKSNQFNSISANLCRTLNNDFTKTNIKFLTIEDSFDSIFLSTCNEYFTSNGSQRKVDIKQLFIMFVSRIKVSRWTNRCLTDEQKLYIGDINKFDSDCIRCYGNVNQAKFDAHLKEFQEKKLTILQKLSNRTLNNIKSTPDYYKKFTTHFEKQYDDLLNE